MAINSLDKLKSLVGNKTFYVRYSSGFEVDRKYKYSKDHQTGETHDGLSAIRLSGDMPDSDLLRRISEYCHTFKPGWVCLAKETGIDTDGAPTIDADTMELIDDLDAGWIKRIVDWSIACDDHRSAAKRRGYKALAECYATMPKPEGL
jgi:hypothetical protein